MYPKAKKELGQNFLRNPKILEAIVGRDELSKTHVIEIGPGRGDLTEKIFNKKPLSLSLIELDPEMIPILADRFQYKPIEVYLHDVLEMDVKKGKAQKNDTSHIMIERSRATITLPDYNVYGNIPYYITSPIIHHFLYDVTFPPKILTLTVQKEVADKILLRDGRHTILSLTCHLMADITKICDIHPNSFFPVPKVWSTCLRFAIQKTDRKHLKKVLSLAKIGFSQKRKKLISNLTKKHPKDVLEKVFKGLQIDPNIRAEQLSEHDWIRLYTSLDRDYTQSFSRKE